MPRSYFLFFIILSFTFSGLFFVINNYSARKLKVYSARIDSLQFQLLQLKSEKYARTFYAEINAKDSNYHLWYFIDSPALSKYPILVYERPTSLKNAICLEKDMHYPKTLDSITTTTKMDSILNRYIPDKMRGIDKRRLCKTCYARRKNIVDSLINIYYKKQTIIDSAFH